MPVIFLCGNIAGTDGVTRSDGDAKAEHRSPSPGRREGAPRGRDSQELTNLANTKNGASKNYSTHPIPTRPFAIPAVLFAVWQPRRRKTGRREGAPRGRDSRKLIEEEQRTIKLVFFKETLKKSFQTGIDYEHTYFPALSTPGRGGSVVRSGARRGGARVRRAEGIRES